MKVSVVGLGKLGACLAACLADRGFPTIGADLNTEVVGAVNRGLAPVAEPRLQELVSRNARNLRATGSFDDVARDSELSFVVVPTPSEPDGRFSLGFLRSAFKQLAAALRRAQKEYHLFVVASTVSPGASEKYIAPLLESVSGMRLNQRFGLCYSPQFMALGSVIEDLLNPDLVLIGESDKRAGDILEDVYRRLCVSQCRIARMSMISAEIAKISLNSFVTMKISFANTLANICEEVPGADLDAICGALGADRRVSPYYLRGGASFGGPCFPRDNRAFVAFAQQYGCAAPLAEATDAVDPGRADATLRRLLRNVRHGDTIAVLGLAYKTNTPIIDESPGIMLVEQLVSRNFKVVAYDPFAIDNARKLFGNSIRYAGSVADCLATASACVITTTSPEFKSVEELARDSMTVFDCWRFLDPTRFTARVKYIAVGRRVA